MKLMRIGVDLAKNVFQIHGVDRHEKPVWRQRLTRERWLQTMFEKIEPGCEIGMESCGGAHHWARQLEARGFRVKLIAPQFVKPYVKSNKNDANDAEAICEAMSRPSMRFVAIKTVEQQDIQATDARMPLRNPGRYNWRFGKPGLSAALPSCIAQRARLTAGHKRDGPTPAPTGHTRGGRAGRGLRN
jgi:hypothetical protein